MQYRCIHVIHVQYKCNTCVANTLALQKHIVQLGKNNSWQGIIILTSRGLAVHYHHIVTYKGNMPSLVVRLIEVMT